MKRGTDNYDVFSRFFLSFIVAFLNIFGTVFFIGAVFLIGLIEEEGGSSEDSSDSEDVAFRENVFHEMENYYRDLVYDRVLARIVDQVDELTFHARVCDSKLIVPCYLRPELYSNRTGPLVMGVVRLGYNYISRVFDIIELIDTEIKEGSPWVWNILVGEIIGEDEEDDERIIYASLEPGQDVPYVLCVLCDHLRDTYIQGGDLVYLEVDETNRAFYKIFEIVEHS